MFIKILPVNFLGLRFYMLMILNLKFREFKDELVNDELV